MLMKVGFSNRLNHDLQAQENLLRDLTGSLERMKKAISSCM
jgi:hypothetical protein